MSVQKSLFWHFPSFRFFFFVIVSLCCCSDVLFSFDLYSNQLMPMATDNGISSAFTNVPVPLMEMPHNPTTAEKFPYEFWHENKPFAHIHGEEPNRNTMRHQHFARPYFDDAFGNFITDPPGMGLNAVAEHQKKTNRGKERNTGEEIATAPNALLIGGERKGETREETTNGWKTDDGQGQFNQMFNVNEVFGKIPSRGEVFSPKTDQFRPSFSPQLSWPTPSSVTEAMSLRQTMKPILRFYHRPKMNLKYSKSNLSPPAIVVPASSSTLEHFVDNGNAMGERHMTKQGNVIDADIPFIEPTDLKDAQPIETPKAIQQQQKNGEGQAKVADRQLGRESAENGHQLQKTVLKTDNTVPTSVSSSAKGGLAMPMHCGHALQNCHDTAAGCDCTKFSAVGFHCTAPKSCCCCGTDHQNELCTSHSSAKGQCCENAIVKGDSSASNVLLLTVHCCCRRRSIRKINQLSRGRFSPLFNRMFREGGKIRTFF